MKPRTLYVALFAGAALAGCSASQKALDARVAEEPPVKNTAQLHAEADQLIREDQSITADQRQRLQQLRQSTSPQLAELERRELRLRSVLVEELLSPNYSADEVDLIKKRLKDLEDQRLALTFQSVDKANSILGRDRSNARATVLRAMLDERVQEEKRGLE